MSGAARLIAGEVALGNAKGKKLGNVLAKKLNDANNYMCKELDTEGRSVVEPDNE